MNYSAASIVLTFGHLHDVAHSDRHLAVVDGVADDGHGVDGADGLSVLPGGVQQPGAVVLHVHVVDVHLDGTGALLGSPGPVCAASERTARPGGRPAAARSGGDSGRSVELRLCDGWSSGRDVVRNDAA